MLEYNYYKPKRLHMILIITVAVTLIITLVIILKIIVIIIKHKSICNNVLLSVDNKTVYYILYKKFFDFLTYTIYIDYSKKKYDNQY